MKKSVETNNSRKKKRIVQEERMAAEKEKVSKRRTLNRRHSVDAWRIRACIKLFRVAFNEK